MRFMGSVEMPAKKIAIISIVVLLVIMMYSGTQMKPAIDDTRTYFIEDPIEKNTEFKLKHGEEFTYKYQLGKESINMSYKIMRGSGCTVIAHKEEAGVSTCVDEQGTDIGGANSTLSNPIILMFRPWMLAVHENWEWSTHLIMNMDGIEKEILNVNYTTIRTDNVNGRKTYVVKITATGEPDSYLWVDAEKRILIKETGADYTLELITELPDYS